VKAPASPIPSYGIDRFNPKPEQPQQYQVRYFTAQRSFSVAYPHRHHDFYEILHITQGTGTYIIDGQPYSIEPNTVFFVSPGQIHELSLSPNVQGHIFLFSSYFYHYNKTDAYKLFELPFFYNLQGSAAPLKLHSNTQVEAITGIFKQAIQEATSPQPDTPDVLRALLDLLLIQAKRLYTSVLPASQSSKSHILVKRFKQLLELHGTQNLGIAQYAQLLGITPNHLAETVKNTTGHTCSQLLYDRTILEIKRLLLHSNLSVSQIAFELNFADQSYFSKYFKKKEGLSPKEWRNQNSILSS
jgi:AraC family transcriptional regulator, transcriptional activator of pobA